MGAEEPLQQGHPSTAELQLVQLQQKLQLQRLLLILGTASVRSARGLLPVRAELAWLCPAGLALGGFILGTDVSLFVPWHHLLPHHPWELLFHLWLSVQTEVSLRSGWRDTRVPRCSETGKHPSAELQPQTQLRARGS